MAEKKIRSKERRRLYADGEGAVADAPDAAQSPGEEKRGRPKAAPPVYFKAWIIAAIANKIAAIFQTTLISTFLVRISISALRVLTAAFPIRVERVMAG
jgi:hypothetical protein